MLGGFGPRGQLIKPDASQIATIETMLLFLFPDRPTVSLHDFPKEHWINLWINPNVLLRVQAPRHTHIAMAHNNRFSCSKPEKWGPDLLDALNSCSPNVQTLCTCSTFFLWWEGGGWFHVVEWRASCVSMCIQHWLNTYHISLYIYDIEGLLWGHTYRVHIYIYIYTYVSWLIWRLRETPLYIWPGLGIMYSEKLP